MKVTEDDIYAVNDTKIFGSFKVRRTSMEEWQVLDVTGLILFEGTDNKVAKFLRGQGR